MSSIGRKNVLKRASESLKQDCMRCLVTACESHRLDSNFLQPDVPTCDNCLLAHDLGLLLHVSMNDNKVTGLLKTIIENMEADTVTSLHKICHFCSGEHCFVESYFEMFFPFGALW